MEHAEKSLLCTESGLSSNIENERKRELQVMWSLEWKLKNLAFEFGASFIFQKLPGAVNFQSQWKNATECVKNIYFQFLIENGDFV